MKTAGCVFIPLTNDLVCPASSITSMFVFFADILLQNHISTASIFSSINLVIVM